MLKQFMRAVLLLQESFRKQKFQLLPAKKLLTDALLSLHIPVTMVFSQYTNALRQHAGIC
ncbi:hypothetical protein BGI09_07510 [Snodgrassella alvi]|nr:hypothetical protein BGI09_07510 [Snodgrassella alvi]